MQKRKNKNIKKLAMAAIAAAITASSSQAAWNQITLPSFSDDYFTAAFANLPDGRAIFGEHGNMYLQASWGSSSFTAFTSEPSPIDPSFISVFDGNTAAIGHGGWGASDVSTFDPGSAASAFSGIGVSIQNYDGVFRDGSSLYTAGADTGDTGDRHGVRYLTTDGSVNKIIINDISQYSTGIAIDGDGNLFVGDNYADDGIDDGKVYKFAKSLLDDAIDGNPLNVADGEFICDFGEGGNIGSLAVDSNGVIWGAGFMHNGLKSFDPSNGSWGSFVPGLDNTNYKVATFSRDGTDYVAYLNSDETGEGSWGNYPQSGDTLLYGYQDAAVIPEPSSALLAVFGVAVAIIRTIRKRKLHG